MTPKHDEHTRLWSITVKHPQDYEPWGTVDRESTRFLADCSSGCVYFRPLDGGLGGDWGVCTNPDSHRAGLLTFEHQGCANALEGDYDPGFTDLEPSCGGCEAPCVPGVGSHPFCRKCWRKIPREARREMIALRRAWDATRGDDPEGDGAPLRIAWAKAARALRGAT
jgi:hypothetical protein